MGHWNSPFKLLVTAVQSITLHFKGNCGEVEAFEELPCTRSFPQSSLQNEIMEDGCVFFFFICRNVTLAELSIYCKKISLKGKH